jgi:hypothetical protein
MARDLIIRQASKTATLVHDEPDLQINHLIVLPDGLFAQSEDSMVFLGPLSLALKHDIEECENFFVVFMAGFRVEDTKKVRLQQET